MEVGRPAALDDADQLPVVQAVVGVRQQLQALEQLLQLGLLLLAAQREDERVTLDAAVREPAAVQLDAGVDAVAVVQLEPELFPGQLKRRCDAGERDA